MTSINWLHLTDLHRGMASQSSLWSNIESEFFDDLTRMHDKCGSLDMILFSGDLTQRGIKQEFEKLNETLSKLYKHLASLGSEPILLTIPGNHDLIRPSTNKAEVVALKHWESDISIRSEFWDNKKSDYRKLINKAFLPYVNWTKNHPFPKPKDIAAGILPGDFSTIIEKDDVTVGIVGLNSTFLQLTGGDYKGKLAINASQMVGVCGDNYNNWFKNNTVNLLMTHQPVDWLNEESRDEFEGEINKAGRFVAHMFGHMHEPQTYANANGGAKPKRYWQGASLFGLEYYGEGNKIQRIHGYSIGRINFKENDAELLLFPRKAVKHQAGHMHLAPDHSLSLSSEGNLPAEEITCNNTLKFSIPPKKTVRKSSTKKVNRNSDLQKKSSEADTQNLILFNYYVRESEPYYVARKIDKEFIDSLKLGNLWIFGNSGSGKTALVNRNLIVNNLEYCFCDLSPVNITSSEIVLEEILISIEDKFNLKREVIKNNKIKQITALLSKIGKKFVIVIDELSIEDELVLKDVASAFVRLVTHFCNIQDKKELKFVVSTILTPKQIIQNKPKANEHFQYLSCNDWSDEIEDLFVLLSKSLDLDLANYRVQILKASAHSPRVLKNILRKILTLDNLNASSIQKAIELVEFEQVN